VKTFSTLRETVLFLSQRGIKVYVIGASPVYHSRVPHIAARDARYGTGTLERYSIEFDQGLDNALRAAVEPHAKYFSPYNILCINSLCRFKQDSNLLHIDHGHLSEYGAALIFDAFLAENPELIR